MEIITFGCRLNSYESEIIKEASSVLSNENIAIINTCAVTKEAERQARQAIRKIYKTKPGVKIIVTGCAAQINPESFAQMKEVQAVLGNQEKLEQKSYMALQTKLEERPVLVNDIMSLRETASHMVTSFEGKARSFIEIQNGCNHRCTFCIIPYGRGNNRSVPIAQIVQQTRNIIASGYQELVLTGVDISGYGEDLPGKPTLAQMIKRLLNNVAELRRLRLSSIDVAEIDEELFDLLASEKRIMPHIHISLQAGDNMILKRMKRRHNRQQIIDFCQALQKRRPEVVFGADMIAGFPTETEEMFHNSLALISEIGLSLLHIFPYSEREGTPAARMPQVAPAIRKKRAAELRKAGEKILLNKMQEFIGQEINVLIEKNDNNYSYGKSDHFLPVEIKENIPAGQVVKTMVKAMDGQKLIGIVNGV